jgi:hypothetical protein
MGFINELNQTKTHGMRNGCTSESSPIYGGIKGRQKYGT